MEKALRKNPTPLQKKKLQQEAESRCPFCGNREPGTWDFHHIDGDKTNTVLENLIMVCGACHKLIDKGELSEADVRLKKNIIAWETKCRMKKKSSSSTIRNSNVAIGNRLCKIVQNVYNKPPAPPKVAPASDSLEGNTKHKNYAKFLIDKLIEYRIKGKVFTSDKEKTKESASIAIAVNQKIKREFKVTSYKTISMENSEKLFQYLKDSIDKTKQGRINRSRGILSYMPFEEYNG